MRISRLHIKQRMETRPVMFSLGLTFCLLGVISQPAKADFVGYYNVSNWTLTNTNNGGFPSFTDGTAVANGGGTSLTMTGGNSGSGFPGETDLYILAAAAGIVQFDWSYSSLDLPGYDSAGYFIDNTYTQLADTDGQSSSLPVSFSVTAGQRFGFAVLTDNMFEPGIFTIMNFRAPSDVSPVPEPNSVALVSALAAAAALLRRAVIRRSAREGGNA